MSFLAEAGTAATNRNNQSLHAPRIFPSFTTE